MSEDEQQAQEKTDLAIVKSAIDRLGEHFCTCQIFVTRHQPESDGATMNLAYGSGNWFARYGQVKEWIVRRDEESRQTQRE